ncbi:MAG: GNAT family N-acetyltransferase [Actinomycetales bacterium]
MTTTLPGHAGSPAADSRYDVRSFPAATEGQPGYEQSAGWLRAVGLGFYDPERTDEMVSGILARYAVDGRELTGAYQRGPVAGHSPGTEVPVATFGTFRKNLNVGYGRQLEAHLVTAVTVRTGHRRRGLLRSIMEADLARAKADGAAVAALMASEAVIYGRYGFGPATIERSITVDTGSRFRLRCRPAGTVEAVDRKVLIDVAPRVFAAFQDRTPGSVDRQESYRNAVSGTPGRDGTEDLALRAALHYGPDGGVDGYVAYRFLGWDKEPATMEVVDLVAATPDAYLGLWDYLGSLDLVGCVTWTGAPPADPLPWALEDARCVTVTAERDALWLRILDLPAALSARRYGADGTLVLEVTDPLGHAAGRFRLSVEACQGTVTDAGAAEPDLGLDVTALASMYLGAVPPSALLEAGRLTEHLGGAAGTAAALFAVERPAFCATHF